MIRVLEKLSEHALNFPDKAALIDEKGVITYREYNDTVQNLACKICAYFKDNGKKIPHNEAIAVLVGRNAKSVMAMLGVSMTGNFYVPIDVSLPKNRVAVILGQMKPRIIIDAVGVTDNKEYEGYPILASDEINGSKTEADVLSEIETEASGNDLIYAVYTSGSTGVPKGVVKAHYSVADFIPIFCRTFSLNSDDVFANQAPFDFDVSGKDIYSALYLGATMYVVPQRLFGSPKKLIADLNEKRVTVLIWAVSALCVAAGMNAFSYEKPEHIRRILFSGEAMPISVLNLWRQVLPEAMYVNLYGPTEVTYNCTYYIVDREYGFKEMLPMGVPFEHQTVRYVSADGSDIAAGEEGEVIVSGPSVAVGYYRDEDSTAGTFVTDKAGVRWLHTGDIVRYSQDGQYYFSGRRDFQIKHMGYRIELEEIEMYLNALEGVTRAGCLYDKDRGKLVCVYSGSWDKREIAMCLRDELPKYMLPNVYVRRRELKLNKNGKLDRAGLADDYIQSLS
ncbi:MAG: AMP-binding protein [Lachnospiraceae bacterium]|nr:AMP-binding protein [Lachnospiraceae bacterium]